MNGELFATLLFSRKGCEEFMLILLWMCDGLLGPGDVSFLEKFSIAITVCLMFIWFFRWSVSCQIRRSFSRSWLIWSELPYVCLQSFYSVPWLLSRYPWTFGGFSEFIHGVGNYVFSCVFCVNLFREFKFVLFSLKDRLFLNWFPILLFFISSISAFIFYY